MVQEITNRDLYTILGVEKTAVSGEIHEAFVSLVPRHPPEKDPEGFAALERAYQTLMDPRAREKYDELMECGDEIATLVNLSIEAAIKGRLKLAEQHLLRVVEETGRASEAVYQLAGVQYDMGHFRTAITTIGELIERFPSVPLYREGYGIFLLRRSAEVEDKAQKDHLVKRAREQFEKVIKLDSRNPLGYLAMAKSYAVEEIYETAFEWTDKAVEADGKEDMEDFTALNFGCAMLGEIEDLDRIRIQLLRIENLVTGDNDEAKQYIAEMLIFNALHLGYSGKHEAAKEIVQAAVRISPDRKRMNLVLQEFEVVLDASRSLEALESDRQILKPIREFAVQTFNHSILKASGDRMDEASEKFGRSLETWPPDEIRRSLLRMKKLYPSVWKLESRYWNFILDLVGGERAGCTGGWWAVVILFILVRLIMYIAQGCG